MTNYTYYIYIYYFNIISRASVLACLLLLIAFSSFSQNSSEIQLANEYLLKGDKKKAVEMYAELSANAQNIPLIHNNYMNTLLDLGMYKEAEDYLKKISRRDPSNLQYKMDQGILYTRAGEVNKADKYFKDLIQENKSSVQRIKMLSDYLSSRSLGKYSIVALNESRDFLGNSFLFCLDLAMLYRIQGEKDKMVREYLSYVTQNAGNLQYVKNVMQALLTKPDELESLERLLYDKVQQYPDTEVYADLLIWVTMQQKNFYASFIQARAFDKRYKNEGEKTMEVARVALDNNDYENAYKIYSYVVKEFENTPNQMLARLGLIRTREARIRNSFPVSKDSVRVLVKDYQNFITQYPSNSNALEATRNMALLYANYLDQKDDAVNTLENLVSNPRTSTYLKSKAKLDLGDIYLLKGEPWESTLLYSQVEKTQRENPVGYEAKLKNAKLSYFKGDFRLAQEHLDILKEATTREIANDAMDLSLLIKENIAFDSVGEALKAYASIELLLYQNKTDQALNEIQMLKRGYRMPSKEEVFEQNLAPTDSLKISVASRSIMDDVYWLEANIRLQRGEFHEAIGLLEKILSEFGDDILADDAFFSIGDIYDRQLHDTAKAMEIYRDFLTKYPGSVYAAEARKRFRTLRGDFNNVHEAAPIN